MLATHVIVKPLITEKATFQSAEFNSYSFEVDRRARKPEIRRAIEEIYGVRVVKIATQNRRGQLRRNKFGYWSTRNIKRAIVKVHPDDRIELF